MHTHTFCKYRKKLLASPRVHLVYIKIIDNVLLHTILGVLQHVLPRFLVTCAIWCVLEYSFRELSLKKIL